MSGNHYSNCYNNDMNEIGIPQGVGRPALRALSGLGYTTLNQLAAMTEQELLALHGVGPKSIKVLKLAFKEHGLKAVMVP